jgi:hypothetical protein
MSVDPDGDLLAGIPDTLGGIYSSRNAAQIPDFVDFGDRFLGRALIVKPRENRNGVAEPPPE